MSLEKRCNINNSRLQLKKVGYSGFFFFFASKCKLCRCWTQPDGLRGSDSTEFNLDRIGRNPRYIPSNLKRDYCKVIDNEIAPKVLKIFTLVRRRQCWTTAP